MKGIRSCPIALLWYGWHPMKLPRAQGNKTDTVYVKFKRKGADEYFLVWTTTP